MRAIKLLYFLFISASLYAQTQVRRIEYSQLDSIEKARFDSIIYSRIPYNENKAINDIRNDTVRIISLTPGGSPANNNDELELLEERFDFSFYFDYLRLPNQYLQQRETEYNNVVYQYLDSIYCIDTKREIQLELIRMYFEREVVSNRTDKELKKIINKSLNGESKEIKNRIFEIDKKYRDRKFGEALKAYNEVSLLDIKRSTHEYLINSKYHCYLNMLQFEQAGRLKKEYEIIKRIKK
jgi:hypothetical protein